MTIDINTALPLVEIEGPVDALMRRGRRGAVAIPTSSQENNLSQAASDLLRIAALSRKMSGHSEHSEEESKESELSSPRERKIASSTNTRRTVIGYIIQIDPVARK